MPSHWGTVEWKRSLDLLLLLALPFSSLLVKAAKIRNKVDSTPGVPHVKKSSCSGRKCKLDLSLIATDATEIAVPVGLNETRLKTFITTGESKTKDHWNGEVDYSYLNLLKKGAGPNGMDLWFGSMYDGEEDVYYDISPDANGASIIATARRGNELPPPMGVKVPTEGNSSMLTTSASTTDHSNRRQLADDGSVTDIMYVWTIGAECQVSGLNPGCSVTAQTEINMRGKIDSIIAATNTIYSQSGISTQLRLVYAYRDPTYTWDYQNNCDDSLYHVTNTNDGQLDDVHTIRSQYRADLVQMITVPCWYCGKAWVSTPISKDLMFSVVATDCLDNFTPAHEIGHNQGCWHDRASGNQCSDPGYNFGYKNPKQGFRDIMSYDCPDCACNYNCGATTCPTAARISNTKLKYNNFPIGNAQNNCAQTINDNSVTIASFFVSSTIAQPSRRPSKKPSTNRQKQCIANCGNPSTSPAPTKFACLSPTVCSMKKCCQYPSTGSSCYSACNAKTGNCPSASKELNIASCASVTAP